MNKWIARIGKEVGAAYSTKTERDAATEFAWSHRLSIANVFERRLCTNDVVTGLLRLFKEARGDHSI